MWMLSSVAMYYTCWTHFPNNIWHVFYMASHHVTFTWHKNMASGHIKHSLSHYWECKDFSPVDGYIFRKAFKNNFSLRPPANALIFWIYMWDGAHLFSRRQLVIPEYNMWHRTFWCMAFWSIAHRWEMSSNIWKTPSCAWAEIENMKKWTIDQKSIIPCIQIFERWCINTIIGQNIQRLLIFVFWLITSKYP